MITKKKLEKMRRRIVRIWGKSPESIYYDGQLQLLKKLLRTYSK